MIPRFPVPFDNSPIIIAHLTSYSENSLTFSKYSFSQNAIEMPNKRTIS